MSSKPRRFREYRVVISGTVTAEFTIERQIAADTPEQAAAAFRKVLRNNPIIDSLSPKVKIGPLKAGRLKSDSIEHTSGDPENGPHS